MAIAYVGLWYPAPILRKGLTSALPSACASMGIHHVFKANYLPKNLTDWKAWMLAR